MFECLLCLATAYCHRREYDRSSQSCSHHFTQPSASPHASRFTYSRHFKRPFCSVALNADAVFPFSSFPLPRVRRRTRSSTLVRWNRSLPTFSLGCMSSLSSFGTLHETLQLASRGDTLGSAFATYEYAICFFFCLLIWLKQCRCAWSSKRHSVTNRYVRLARQRL